MFLRPWRGPSVLPGFPGLTTRDTLPLNGIAEPTRVPFSFATPALPLRSQQGPQNDILYLQAPLSRKVIYVTDIDVILVTDLAAAGEVYQLAIPNEVPRKARPTPGGTSPYAWQALLPSLLRLQGPLVTTPVPLGTVLLSYHDGYSPLRLSPDVPLWVGVAAAFLPANANAISVQAMGAGYQLEWF